MLSALVLAMYTSFVYKLSRIALFLLGLCILYATLLLDYDTPLTNL